MITVFKQVSRFNKQPYSTLFTTCKKKCTAVRDSVSILFFIAVLLFIPFTYLSTNEVAQANTINSSSSWKWSTNLDKNNQNTIQNSTSTILLAQVPYSAIMNALTVTIPTAAPLSNLSDNPGQVNSQNLSSISNQILATQVQIANQMCSCIKNEQQIEDQVISLQNQQNQIQKQINTLNNQENNINTSTTSGQNQQNQINQEIQQLQQKLNNLGTSMNNVQNNLSNVTGQCQQDVGQLEQNRSTLEGNLDQEFGQINNNIQNENQNQL